MIWVNATAYGFMLHDMGVCYSIWGQNTAYGYLLQHMGLAAQHMGTDPLTKYCVSERLRLGYDRFVATLPTEDDAEHDR